MSIPQQLDLILPGRVEQQQPVHDHGPVLAVRADDDKSAGLWSSRERVQRDGAHPAWESVRAQLDEAAFDAAWAEGQKVTLEHTVEYALTDT